MTLFHGMVTPAPTPFNANGSIAPERIEPLAAFHKEKGIGGFFSVGTWGAFPLMSTEERKVIGAAWCKAGQKVGLPVAIQIGSPSMQEACELAKHAIDNGADAVASVIPYYYASAGFYGIDHYKTYFAALIKAAGGKPVMLYNNPRTTGTLLTPAQFVELCREGVSGIKDGSVSADWLTDAIDLLEQAGIKDCEIMPGNTSGLLFGLMYGVKAIVSGTAVTSPELCNAVIAAWKAGENDKAARLHRRVLTIQRTITKLGKPPVLAYGLLKRLGVDIGAPRLPWMAPAETELDKLHARIKEIEAA
jgi:dihydrodipicolinate synthase/N-acetylneuraminate lyase